MTLELVRVQRRHDVELRAHADPEEPGDWCCVTVYSAAGACLGQVELSVEGEFVGEVVMVSALVVAGVGFRTDGVSALLAREDQCR